MWTTYVGYMFLWSGIYNSVKFAKLHFFSVPFTDLHILHWYNTQYSVSNYWWAIHIQFHMEDCFDEHSYRKSQQSIKAEIGTTKLKPDHKLLKLKIWKLMKIWISWKFSLKNLVLGKKTYEMKNFAMTKLETIRCNFCRGYMWV